MCFAIPTFKPSNVLQKTRRRRQSAAASAPATGPDLEALHLKAELRRRVRTRQTLIRAACSAQTCANGRSPVGIALYFTAAEARHTLSQPNRVEELVAELWPAHFAGAGHVGPRRGETRKTAGRCLATRAQLVKLSAASALQATVLNLLVCRTNNEIGGGPRERLVAWYFCQ